MKILAVNGSPRGSRGNTERILVPFLVGAAEAGAETATVYLKDKRIDHCLGCFSCWTRTPGACVHQDDMPELLKRVAEADLVVYASPLYNYSVTGLMKDFMDRKLPLLSPVIETRDGQYGHPLRDPAKNARKTVLISNCGFPGRDNFAILRDTFNVLTQGQLTAAILRTQGELLRIGELQAVLRPFFEAVRQAGREVVECGGIRPETQVRIDNELMDPKAFQEMANGKWRQKAPDLTAGAGGE